MKKITLIFLLLFLSSCGYSSIYNNQKSLDFKINIFKFRRCNFIWMYKINFNFFYTSNGILFFIYQDRFFAVCCPFLKRLVRISYAFQLDILREKLIIFKTLCLEDYF